MDSTKSVVFTNALMNGQQIIVKNPSLWTVHSRKSVIECTQPMQGRKGWEGYEQNSIYKRAVRKNPSKSKC